MNQFNTQVDKTHYNSKYDHIERFISYHQQVRLLTSLPVKRILEIGVGSGFLKNYLERKGYSVTSADFDETLNPDVVCDVRSLPFKEGEYDVVCAFEVLEHLPYHESLLALSEMARTSSRYIVVSVPRSCAYFSINLFFGLPIFRKLFPLGIRLPFFWINASTGNKQHYWELGRKGYPVSKLLGDIKKSGLKIRNHGHVALNTQHYFFVLEK